MGPGIGDPDLVLISLPGVQRLISEARTTADVHGGSAIIADLATTAAHACRDNGELVIPDRRVVPPKPTDGSDVAGMSSTPNRIVALAPEGQGVELAHQVVAAVHQRWEELLAKIFRDGLDLAAISRPPAIVWVCVPPLLGGYSQQWTRGQALLTARRRVRDFMPFESTGHDQCALSPRWCAVDADYLQNERLRKSPRARTPLSVLSWVKRLHGGRFPSTPSIASAPFRHEVLQAAHRKSIRSAIESLWKIVKQLKAPEERAIDGLRVTTSVPEPIRWFAQSSGPWIYPDRWQASSIAHDLGRPEDEIRPLAERGRQAAKNLIDIATKEYGIAAPSSYMAVLAQDIDSMGLYLSGKARNAAGNLLDVSPDTHRQVSLDLANIAKKHLAILTDRCRRDTPLLGVPVYRGGDDLLALLPAGSALAAARECREAVPIELPTASTAVLFFHAKDSLQEAVSAARALLAEAKAARSEKNMLAVGYLRRSGTKAQSIQPWDGDPHAVDLFAGEPAGRLSPRLVADLTRDADQLHELAKQNPQLFRAELIRLVRRHLPDQAKAAAPAIGERLFRLGWDEGSHGAKRPLPIEAARVNVFLREFVCG